MSSSSSENETLRHVPSVKVELPQASGDAPWKSIEAAAAAVRDPRAAFRGRLANLKALVLLSGTVKGSEFISSIGRSVLDLPVSADHTILDLWRGHALRLSRLAEQDKIPVRLLLSWASTPPTSAPGDPEMGLNAERDPYDLRGTGGVLRDIAENYNADDYLLVATAAQILLEPLGELTAALEATGGDLCVLSHENGTPSGLMLVRCRCLRRIPDVGFIDIKEQGLPLIAAHDRVTVLRQTRTMGLPIRTLEQYTRALHTYHRRISGDMDTDNALAERWFSAAAIVERGADVHASARLHDSVVLRGSRVGKDAVLVRSIVCPGGVVRRGQHVVGAVVRAQN